MKKILVLILLIISICSFVNAANIKLEYDGEVHTYSIRDVTLILKDKIFVPTEGLMPPIILEDRTLVPVREVFEALNGLVNWNEVEKSVEVTLGRNNIKLWINKETAKVNGEDVKLDVPAKLINSKTMVPVRFISENGGLNVDWNQDTYTVTITPKENTVIDPIANIKSVNKEVIDEATCVVIETDISLEKYNIFTLEDPNRIIIDLYNTKFGIPLSNITVEDNNLINIRLGEQGNNINRIVLDVNDLKEYSVKQNEDKNKIYIALSKDFKIEEKDGISEVEPDIPDIINLINVTEIKYSSLSDKLRVILDEKTTYSSFTLTNPDRVVLDINNAKLNVDGPTSLTTNNKILKSIKFSQYNETTVRVVLELKSKVNYNVTESKKEIHVEVEEIPYRNIEYKNLGDTAQITLFNTSLNKLTTKQSKSSKTYTITYSSKNFDSGKGNISVKDKFVEKIAITQTKVTITDKGNLTYLAKQDGDNVILSIKPNSKIDGNRVIAIDVGHGGNDPGAVNGTAYEKTYNLAIAKKLYELLDETDGITVYMNRKTDISIPNRFDRVDFANDKNADLLVSIHNNSVTNKSYDGTMVLFYNKETDLDYGVTSKTYAQTVLKELVDALGTSNRGVVSRNDLVVLTDTNMPAILCEIAFVSNDDELERLKTDKFQQDAAEAIYTGILKTLEMMD